MSVAAADPPIPSDARLMSMAAKPAVRLFRVLEDPRPLRPLLAALAVLPAILAFPRCRLERVDPAWGSACLAAAAADAGPLETPGGVLAWLTGLLLHAREPSGPLPFFVPAWAGATLLVWAVWQMTAAAWNPRAAAFAALFTATNPVTIAAAADGPQTAGVGAGVVAAWLWVRLLRNPDAPAAVRRPRTWGSLGAGAAAGVAVLLAGPAAAGGPVAVVLASLPFDLFGPRRRRRPALLAGFVAGAAPFVVAAVLSEPLTAPGAVLRPFGLLTVAGLAALGLWCVGTGRRWAPRTVRAAALGWTAAAVPLAAAGWFGGGAVGPVAVLTGLVAAATLAGAAVESACRPALPVRLVTLLAILPALALAGAWVWDDDPVRFAWRAVFAAAAAVGTWGAWQVVAFGTAPEARSRRLLIGALLAIAVGGAVAAARRAAPDLGGGVDRLAAALARRPTRTVLILTDPEFAARAAFLVAAAAPDRRAVIAELNRDLDARLVEAAADPGGTTVAAVGGAAAVRLGEAVGGREAPLRVAGSLAGREVRLAFLGPAPPEAPPNPTVPPP